MMGSLNELISNLDNWKPEIGDGARLMGHWLKIIKIDKSSPFGHVYTLNCYQSGCCTVPVGIEMKCNFKSLKVIRKDFLKWGHNIRKRNIHLPRSFPEHFDKYVQSRKIKH